jgi:hypothetical protein
VKTFGMRPTQLDLFFVPAAAHTNEKVTPSLRPLQKFSAPIISLNEKRLQKKEELERKKTRRVLSLLDL